MGQSDESDIQLSGLGIHEQHAEMAVVEDENGTKVIVTPFDNAK